VEQQLNHKRTPLLLPINNSSDGTKDIFLIITISGSQEELVFFKFWELSGISNDNGKEL
jgi:hypothetical protein